MVDMTIKIHVDDTELWKGVFGSGWENASWVQGWGYKPGTDWDIPGVVLVQADDPNSENENASIRKDVTLNDVIEAVGKLLNHSDGHFHCGSKVTLEEIIENGDACTGDIVMQYVMYGEVVY